MVKRVLVTGAGGFIGHHLVKFLSRKGYWVRGVDIKENEFEECCANEFKLMDLREWNACKLATDGIDEVYNRIASYEYLEKNRNRDVLKHITSMVEEKAKRGEIQSVSISCEAFDIIQETDINHTLRTIHHN